MRVAGESIARQAGIENGDLAAGTAELQGGGEAGKAAADDDDVIHGDGLRVVDRGGGVSQPSANPRLVRTIVTAKQGRKRALFGFDLEAVDVEHEGGHEKQSKRVCQERGPAKQYQ